MGKRRRKSIYGVTKREVTERLAQVKHAHHLGVLPAAGRQSTADYLTRWLNDTAKLTVRPSTFRRYSDIVTHHLIPSLGKVPLEKLSRQHVQAMYRAKSEAGLSPRWITTCGRCSEWLSIRP